jgi:hypothetical protein
LIKLQAARMGVESEGIRRQATLSMPKQVLSVTWTHAVEFAGETITWM